MTTLVLMTLNCVVCFSSGDEARVPVCNYINNIKYVARGTSDSGTRAAIHEREETMNTISTPAGRVTACGGLLFHFYFTYINVTFNVTS